MTDESRTFKVRDPHMKGEDVKEWQIDVDQQFAEMEITCPIDHDGIYDVATRSYTASLIHSFGLDASATLKDGLTPKMRSKLRHGALNSVERYRFHSPELVRYRRKLRKRWGSTQRASVRQPVDKILADSWGYHPGVHDGLDVICPPNAVIYAMVAGRVIDVRSRGWWGLGAPSDPDLKAKGDGIIQIEVLDAVGPFKKGMHIAYGHAEKSRVRVGEVVRAGEALGHAGLANAWHIHLMINDGSVGTRGVGNINPRGYLDYAIEHG